MADTSKNKQENPLISVIVPVYKVEQYLTRCLDSIIAQTYRNMEIILVDDGSPDKCGEICDEYAKKYPFIKVLHQSNTGLSGARNNAVLIAGGEYITFVDSDDYIVPEYLEYLIGLINRYQASIAVGGMIYQYENAKLHMPRKESYSEFYTTEEALSRMNYGKEFSVFAWGKLYKRKLVETNPYPIGKIYEDSATTCKIIGCSDGIAFGNQQIYYWIQRPGSITNRAFDDKQLDGIETALIQLDYIEQNYPSALASARYRYTAKAIELMGLCFASGGNKLIYKNLRKHAQRYAKDVLRDRNAKATMKIRIAAMRMGYYPCRFIFGIHKIVKDFICKKFIKQQMTILS